MLAATLLLALAGGGLYAAWMYRPDFRAFVQPQIDRIMTLVRMALPPTQTPKPAKTASITAPTTAAPQPAVNSNQAASTVPPSASADLSADAASPSAVTETAAAAGNSAATAAPASTSTAIGTSEPEVNKSGAINPGHQSVVASKQADSKKAEQTQSNSEKPDASGPVDAVSANAIILSSQGAQKRLLRSVAPKYPVDAHSRAAQGTILLKTFVGSDGNVSGVRLVEGNATLAPAAVEAVRQWRYRPYVRDGKAYPFQTVVILGFQRP
jgi:TonB family protein